MSQIFRVGQYVELSKTIPSSFSGSITTETRGIVQEVDISADDHDRYLVAFLVNERLTGEAAWLLDGDLHAA